MRFGKRVMNVDLSLLRGINYTPDSNKPQFVLTVNGDRGRITYMFKAKVIALYILLTLLVVLTSLNLFGEEGASERRSAARARTYNGVEAFRAVQERDQRRRGEKARALAEGPLASYMEELRKYRVLLMALEEDIYDTYPKSDAPQEELSRAELRRKRVKTQHAKLVEDFSTDLTNSVEKRMKPGEFDRAGFKEDTARKLEEWGAVGHNLCLHRFTYLPLMSEMQQWAKSDGAPEGIAIVVDDRGTAWANTKNAKWSEKVSFAEEQPLVRAGRRGLAHGLVQVEDIYYFATAHPILGNKGRVNGVVLVGQEVDVANYADPLGKALGMDVALLLKDKWLVSNRDKSKFREFVLQLDESVPVGDRRQTWSRTIPGSTFEGSLFYLVNQGSIGVEPEELRADPLGEEVRVVLAVDVAQALDDLENVRLFMPMLALLICFLGCAFLLIGVWYYQRPFEKIDQGIHEIISGNQNYEFEFELNEELADSIAQNLNMMVAILSGRPLPDDIEAARGQNWVESMLIGSAFDDGTELDSEDVDASAAGKNIATDSTPTPSARTEAELSKEPAEKYYRRIFSEFLAQREALGMDNEGLTYVRFVDRVVKSERALKSELSARSIRFNIEVKAGSVVLTPVRLG